MSPDKLTENIDILFKKIRTILIAKSNDYNDYLQQGEVDLLSNFKSSRLIGIHPVTGLLLRVLDKIKRIQTFVQKGRLSVQDEGVVDALMDVIGYMTLLYCLIIDDAADSL